MKPPIDERDKQERAALAAIIRPIVIGQLKASQKDHPESVGKNWIGSIEKRIVNDLLSCGVRLRLRSALGVPDMPGSAGDGMDTYHCAISAGDGYTKANGLELSAGHVSSVLPDLT